jgi:peptidoglycan/LPS O-acetylase OafA/YrhL
MSASPVEKRSDGNRILELDGLRAFAIVSVFLYHVWSLPLSWMGVDVFFVLSGCAIEQKPDCESGLYDFRLPRFWRLPL